MFQVRIHGRGGQGVVTVAELLSLAAFADDRYAQTPRSFGSAHVGAPVVAYCRFADHPIGTHEPVTRPDAVVVQDATLLHQVDVLDGLGPGGYLLVDSARGVDDLGVTEITERLLAGHVATVPATELAVEHLGRPLPAAALAGGLAALSRRLPLASVLTAIDVRFTGTVCEGNTAAAAAAFDRVAAAIGRVVDA